MKALLKKILPPKLIHILHILINEDRIYLAYRYDRLRYQKYYTKEHKHGDEHNIESGVIYYAHSIEKGLSHAEFRNGFGKDALKNLRINLEKLQNHDSIVYRAGISAIKAYIEIHEKNSFDISEQKDIIGKELLSEAKKIKSNLSGYLVMSKRSKVDNKTKNFKDLFMNRYTVREFSDEPVDDKKIYSALEVAMKTPTVCNRQSFRVMLIKDKILIKKLLKIQSGFNGYDMPPVLTLILTDTRSFRGIYERNNIYIDGGSFMMAFLLGLEYEGLAACPLNTMFSVKNEKLTRKVLGVADNYNFISYIAIGNFRDKNKVAKSFRFPVDDIIIKAD